AAASAFSAAVLIDPRAMFPQRPKPPPAQTGPSLDTNSPGTWPWYEPPPTLPKEPPPPPPPPASPPLKLHVGAALTGCAGCGPAPNAGGTIFFGIARERLGVDLGAHADASTSVKSPSGRDVSASLVIAELFPHARLGPARLGVLGQLGALFGETEDQK